MPSFTGTNGNNTLAGSTGADTLTGLAGDDTYTVNHLGDVIVEAGAGGTDTVRSSVLDALGTYSLERWQQVENLTYTGTLAALLKGNALANVIQGSTAADTLWGGGGNDTLQGLGGNDVLQGGAGNDSLDGGTGNDTMIGGAGNDRYLVAQPGDRVLESAGGGTDTIVSAVAKDLRVAWAKQVEGLTYTGATAATLHGNALANTVESLAATGDLLFGYGGNDTLKGGAGGDTLHGGAGNDVYFVDAADLVNEDIGAGTDTFVGTLTDLSIPDYEGIIENLFYTGAAGATLQGNGLANVISGGAGNDTVQGNGGDDSLFGGAGADSLVGGAGNDFFYGGGLNGIVFGGAFVADTAVDRLVGGAGNDRYHVDSASDVVVEAAGAGGGTLDVVFSTIDNSLTRYANVEALVLQRGSSAWLGRGGGGNDVLVGNESDNYLVGGGGNDTLAGWINHASATQPESDVLEGGAGNDVLIVLDYDSLAQPREAALFGGSGDDLYVLGSASAIYGGLDTGGTDTAVMLISGSIEQLEGVDNIVLWGADAGLQAAAQDAIEKVHAAANPSAFGGLGTPADAIGNDLNNQILGNALANYLAGGAGDDTIVGSAGNDTLDGGTGADSLTGGAGDDEYFLEEGGTAIELADQGYDILNSYTIESLDGYDHFEGFRYLGANALNLRLGVGNTTNDLLGGGSGNDTVLGYGGNDTLDGGAGDDTINGGADSDEIYGGAGWDALDGGAGNDLVEGGDGDDIANGGADNDQVNGGGGSDYVFGGSGNDFLTGETGLDQLYGEAGDDDLDGGNGNDSVSGGEGNDTLVGGAGDDLVYGGTQTNSGSGLIASGDVLWGDEVAGDGTGGMDTFGIDTVTSDNGVRETFNGSGVFVFNTGALIADFAVGTDVIAFNPFLVGNGDAVIDNAQVMESAGTFDADAELVIFRTDMTGALSFSDVLAPFEATAVDAVVDNPDAAIGVNVTKLFVVDNGTDSAVFLFQSTDGNATVTLDELYLLAVVKGQTELTPTDFALLSF